MTASKSAAAEGNGGVASFDAGLSFGASFFSFGVNSFTAEKSAGCGEVSASATRSAWVTGVFSALPFTGVSAFFLFFVRLVLGDFAFAILGYSLQVPR